MQVVELSPTVAAVLEQVARVEAARLSLVKPLVETNKIFAAKDLNEDDLDDLLERSKSVMTRTELVEPFQERFPLSHTLMSEFRVSPSRSVGSMSPTSDLSLEPLLVETVLDVADTKVCDVLFEEEILPAPSTEVTRPPVPRFDSSDITVVEDNLPQAVSATHDVEFSEITSGVIESALEVADTKVCDVLFEEEILPAPSTEVTRPPVPRFDSSDMVVLEDNLPEVMSAMGDVEFSELTSGVIEESLDVVDTKVCDVLFEEEILPAPSTDVTRPPAPRFDSSDMAVVEDNLPEAVSATDEVESLSITCSDTQLELYRTTTTEVKLRECEEEILPEPSPSVYERPPSKPPSVCHPDERSTSPFVFDECLTELHDLETATVTSADVHGALLEKAAVLEEESVYFIEEEDFVVEATVDIQQLMKLREQEVMQYEERGTSPFTDDHQFVRRLPSDADLHRLAPHDHVTEQATAQSFEADVYYYEEESMVVDIVCDLTQMTQMTQRDLIISEERPVSPVQDESVFIRSLSTDVELVSTEATDHVGSALSLQAQANECDIYYYEEESYSVDVACDISQRLLQLTAGQFPVEEHVWSETVQLESSSVDETSTHASDVKPISTGIAANNRSSSESHVLPQVVVHDVETASRMSPLPAGITSTSSLLPTVLDRASVEECTIFSQDEETFSQSTLEQTTTFDQRLEAFADQQTASYQRSEIQEEEILDVAVELQKSGFEKKRLEVPVDDVDLYSSGEETTDWWTVETYRIYEETRNVEAEMMFRRSQQTAAAAAKTQQREDVYEETRNVEAEVTVTKQREAFATPQGIAVVNTIYMYMYVECAIMLSPVRLFVCPSVRYTWWISQKRLKLGLCNFHHTVAISL